MKDPGKGVHDDSPDNLNKFTALNQYRFLSNSLREEEVYATEEQISCHLCPQGPNTGHQTQHLSEMSLNIDSKSLNLRG